MRSLNKARRAFTLIEILIVVVILGILAAIVIPQFTDASEEAQRSNLQSQLQTLRSQVELWNVQNPATPFNGTDWDQLLLNDYLQTPPKNPIMNGDTTIAAAPDGSSGWIWNDAAGYGTSIYATVPAGHDYDSANVGGPAQVFDGDQDGTPD